MEATDDRVVVQVTRGPVALPVLARAAGAVAARCDLPIDRLEDLVLLLGTLLEGRSPDGAPLAVELEGLAGALAVRAGPYADGEAERVRDAPGPHGTRLLTALAGGATVEPPGRYVSFVVADARPGSPLL